MPLLMFLKAAATLATAAFAWLRERQMITLVQKADEAKRLEETTDAIDEAHQARLAVDRAVRREPDGLRTDDGFRRD